MSKKLYRSTKEKMLCGICGGFAEYFNIDPVIVRIITIILGLFLSFGAILLYIIFALVIPTDIELNAKENNNIEKENNNIENKEPEQKEQ